MPKVLINIPDYMLKDIQDRYRHPNKGDGIDLLEYTVAEGTVLRNDATNGDVMQLMYPQVDVFEYDTQVKFDIDGGTTFHKKWWDSLYLKVRGVIK